jgi:hypothetical protein
MVLPCVSFSLSQVLDELWYKERDMNLGRHVMLTIVALVPAWIVSLLTDNLGVILELVGALGSIILGRS